MSHLIIKLTKVLEARNILSVLIQQAFYSSPASLVRPQHFCSAPAGIFQQMPEQSLYFPSFCSVPLSRTKSTKAERTGYDRKIEGLLAV